MADTQFSSVVLPDQRRLVYALDPPTNTPLVILANPLNAQLTLWDHVTPLLRGMGFRVLRYNQPGHGGSGTLPSKLGEMTIGQIADDVYYLLTTHLKIEVSASQVIHWIGVSMGAATGVTFTAKYPGIITRLAICDTTNHAPLVSPSPFVERIKAMRERDGSDMTRTIDETLDRWFGATWMAAHPEEAQRVRKLMLEGATADGFETCCHALANTSSFDLRPLFPRLASSLADNADVKPNIICIVGEHDANLPDTMAEMRDEIARGYVEAGRKPDEVELKVISNAGHVCFIDGFDQFKQIIVDFLQ